MGFFKELVTRKFEFVISIMGKVEKIKIRTCIKILPITLMKQ